MSTTRGGSEHNFSDVVPLARPFTRFHDIRTLGVILQTVPVHTHFPDCPKYQLKPNSIMLASSELAPNMFGASLELAPNMFRASSELVEAEIWPII